MIYGMIKVVCMINVDMVLICDGHNCEWFMVHFVYSLGSWLMLIMSIFVLMSFVNVETCII